MATHCTFTSNTAKSAGGALGVYVDGTAVLAGCTFTVPTDTSAGNNDVFEVDDGDVIFACPSGKTGAPVKMKGANAVRAATDLPPAAKIVHCA